MPIWQTEQSSLQASAMRIISIRGLGRQMKTLRRSRTAGQAITARNQSCFNENWCAELSIDHDLNRLRKLRPSSRLPLQERCCQSRWSGSYRQPSAIEFGMLSKELPSHLRADTSARQ